MTVHVPNRPNTFFRFFVEDLPLLELHIQVHFLCPFCPSIYHFSLTSKLFTKPDSIQTIEGALVHIPQPQPIGQFSSSAASQHVQTEAHPPVLVPHLMRFQYDVAMGGSTVKINKPVQLTLELDIPPGTIFSFLPHIANTKNPSVQKPWNPSPGNPRSQ